MKMNENFLIYSIYSRSITDYTIASKFELTNEIAKAG